MCELLPPNATEQECALAETVSRIGDVPVVVREMWNPDTCPANLLPWMAWAFSVDDWNDGWTEAQKRGAIKTSVNVHAHKGTIGAVKTALGSLGYDLTLTEWFQKTPVGDPYTFTATVSVDQTGIPSNAVYESIVSVANSTKNLRSHLTGVNVQGITRATEYYAARVFMGEVINIQAEPTV